MAKKKRKTKKAPRKKKRIRKAKKVRRKVKKQAKTLESQELVHRTHIRVIGIGGGGSSIVSEIAPQVQRVDFVVANTDIQALKQASRSAKRLHFGQNLTHGLGCGMDARLGQKTAREAKNRIAKLFQGIDLCILVSCLGGGTGSGATPEFAKIARDMGVKTFGIFTLPFKFEGGKKAQVAKNSLKKITPNLNALSVIPNENIFQIIDKKTPLKQAFSAVNKRLAENLRGLCEMIYLPGLINIDFADLKAMLEGRGKLAYLNSATCQGPDHVEEAAKQVLKSPLSEYSIQGAEKIIFNMTANQDLGMKEVEYISQTISNFNRRAKIIFGVSQNSNYRNKIRIALLAVGCGKEPKPKPKPRLKPKPRSKSKPRRRVKSKPRPKRKHRPKPKPRPQPKPKKKRKKPVPIKAPVVKKKKRKKPKPVPVFIPVKVKKETPNKTLTRKNALDLRKETEKAEEEILEQEKKWDIPAFLRKKPEGE